MHQNLIRLMLFITKPYCLLNYQLFYLKWHKLDECSKAMSCHQSDLFIRVTHSAKDWDHQQDYVGDQVHSQKFYHVWCIEEI